MLIDLFYKCSKASELNSDWWTEDHHVLTEVWGRGQPQLLHKRERVRTFARPSCYHFSSTRWSLGHMTCLVR